MYDKIKRVFISRFDMIFYLGKIEDKLFVFLDHGNSFVLYFNIILLLIYSNYKMNYLKRNVQNHFNNDSNNRTTCIESIKKKSRNWVKIE